MSYICSISLSPPVGIAIELYARRSVYFSCAPLIRQRGESGGEKKLKAPERPIVCGAGGIKKKKKKARSSGPHRYKRHGAKLRTKTPEGKEELSDDTV